MSSPDPNSETYMTKSVTWNIRRQSSWCSSSPIFYINSQECIIITNIASNGYNYQYTINSVELKFTNSFADFLAKFIVILKFANKSPEYIFYALPVEGNNRLFSANDPRTVTEATLGTTNCSISVVILYKKQKEFKQSNIPINFLGDMKCMLKSEIHSDFQIKAGDTIFKVHKAVIATRCDVLKTMVDNDMLEKKTSQLELHADPVVVQALLEYLYTTTCKLAVAPTELYKLAHFLDLEELQILCENYLLSNINLKNIISILELTSYNDYNLKDLHDAAISFVNQNENSLITDLEFQQFLCNSIKLETITYILRLSYKHQLDTCLNKAMEFIRINYKKVLKDTEFKKYLESQPALNLKILHYCLDFFNADSNKKE